MYTFYTAIWIH